MCATSVVCCRRPSDKLSGAADYEAFQPGTPTRLKDTCAKFIPAKRVINLTKLICSARPPKSLQPAGQMVERDFLDRRRVTWQGSRGRDKNERGGKTSGRGRRHAGVDRDKRRAQKVQRNKDTETGLRVGQHHL